MTAIQDFPASTRVWVYQADRPFTPTESVQLKEIVDRFAQHWASHNRQLRAHGDLLYGRFILLMVDENQADASGCSIDKSVHFLQQVETEFGVGLFDRMTFTWMDEGEVKAADSMEFARLYQAGEINDQTLVFDNLVKTKGELDEKWLRPLAQSWHKRFV